MLMYINYDISFAPASLDPLRVSVKQEEQIWYLNMKSIKLQTPVTNLYTIYHPNELRLHGPMHILWYLGHC